MVFKKNPFFILNLGCDAGRQEIYAVSAELSLLVEDDGIEKAQGDLLSPTRRLSAEMDWFPGVRVSVLKQIHNAIEQGKGIIASWANGLTKLNIDIYNFSLKQKQLAEMKEKILELDHSFSAISTEDVKEILNEARKTAGMPEISENDVKQQLLRKQHELQQVISKQLESLSEESYISLVTELAEERLKQNLQGGVVDGTINLYELKMQDILLKRANDILEQIQSVISCETGDVLREAVDALIKDVEKWDWYAQPLQLKCQANGLKHGLSEKLGHELQQLAVRIHNEKSETETAAYLIQKLKPIFAELPGLAETLTENDDTLTEMVEIDRLRLLAEKLEDDTREELQVDVYLLREKVTELNRVIIERNQFNQQVTLNHRVAICQIVREASIALHNSRIETEFSLELTKRLEELFSDIPELNIQLRQDRMALERQAEAAPTARRSKYGGNLPPLPVKEPTQPRSINPDKWKIIEEPNEKETSKHDSFLSLRNNYSGKICGTANPIVIIGSSDQADVRINEKGIEPIHAMILYNHGVWWIYDELSHSGVFVNGKRIERENGKILHAGDTIQLGELEGFRVVLCKVPKKRENIFETIARLFKKQKRPVIQFAIGIVAVALTALIVLGAIHNRAIKLYHEGTVVESAEILHHDLLSNKDIRADSAYRAGEFLFGKKDYSGALRYYEWAGSSAEEKACLCRAWLKIDGGKYEQAIDLLTPMNNSYLRNQCLDEAYLQQGNELLGDGKTDEALQVYDYISDYGKRTMSKDAVYFDKGIRALTNGYTDEAEKSFKKCVYVEEGLEYAEILGGIRERKYYESALRAETASYMFNGISMEVWKDVFAASFAAAEDNSIDFQLEEYKVNLYLDAGTRDWGDYTASFLQELHKNYSLWTSNADDLNDNRKWIMVPSLEIIIKQCGEHADGKVLVLHQRKVLPSGKKQYAIAINIMSKLPDQYFPKSLDEVEYIIVLKNDYEIEGSYIGVKTKGVRLNSQISVIQKPKGKVLYDSGIVKGSSSPEFSTYVGSPPDYVSGSNPDLDGKVEKALEKIFQRHNES